MRTFRVISPGVQSLVQDLGRPGHASIGVPSGGAADRLSCIVGNRLVGNPDAAATVELAMLGLEAVFEHDAIICVAGSRAVASIDGHASRPLAAWSPARIEAGERLRIKTIGPGLRTYLCIAGGVRVPPALGSASTLPGAGLGGVQGRALRAGDEIECGEPMGEPRTPGDSLASWMHHRLRPSCLRVVEGIDAPVLGREALDALLATPFAVGLRSNRVGLRLEASGGVPEALLRASTGRMLSMGMTCGAIELPPGGEPLLLGVDHPTTGGYPVLACVIEADLPAMGHLAPRDSVRFELVDRETALREAARLRTELEQELPTR